MPVMTDIDDALAALRRGQIVCLPTESSYGLAVDIANPGALARLSDLKGRSADAPFGLIAGTVEHARALARVWPDIARELAARHWPGPLTLVVPARSDLPAEIVGPGGVGVRVSSHPIARQLALALGRPITATSANPSGAAPALECEQARVYFGDRVVYLDGGPALSERPSTVIEVSETGALRVLRPGPIEITVPADPSTDVVVAEAEAEAEARD